MNIDDKLIKDQIQALEVWLELYKKHGLYHQRFHCENELKRLYKALAKSEKSTNKKQTV